MKKTLLLTFLSFTSAIFFSSCSIEELITPAQTDVPPATEEGINYQITAGRHETTNPLKTFTKSKIKFEVKFDSTAIYTTKDPNNQADINKLYGMADCGAFHHVSSARFGWRWYKGKLELHAYSYKDGKNTSTFITDIDLNKSYVCELTLTDGKYTYQVKNNKVEHERSCSGQGQGYQLYPYFGGDEKAPHTINIKIKEIQ
ncbi:hypothetical protein [Nibribacter koreensis]|uniref:hypothetical protein n=1 Tax=Nibribacter koreensis TaxID=1084519 RepID=UPI0031EF27CD